MRAWLGEGFFRGAIPSPPLRMGLVVGCAKPDSAVP